MRYHTLAAGLMLGGSAKFQALRVNHAANGMYCGTPAYPNNPDTFLNFENKNVSLTYEIRDYDQVEKEIYESMVRVVNKLLATRALM